jgi:membrane-bound lytic murein transglycosylase D
LIQRIFLFLSLLGATPFALAGEQLALSKALPVAELATTLPTARNVKIELLSGSDARMADLWVRARAGFAMRELESPLIAKHEQWYANRPDYVARMTERAGRYLYFIMGEVERRGMPTEIALLPMIESAFNPGAYSVSRASGIWQFIPSTGKNFGMAQNWWYDGRRDIVSATTGALDYLQKLHDMFGDWELALAAYNCGEGAVQRAQARNRARGLPVNYTSLKLPEETRNYVPKLLAIKNIVATPAAYGLVLQPIRNEPYFTAIATAKHIDVKLAAQLADMTVTEFVALNPAHNRPVILQENSDLILLPIDKVETFRANLEAYDKPLVSWQAYQAKKGERIDRLAPRFGLSVERLKEVNGLAGRSHLSAGQTLLVPINGEVADNEFESFNMHLHPVEAERQGRLVSHVVRRGETLASVARRYGVSLAALKRMNGNSTRVRVGQTLQIKTTAVAKKTRKSSRSASAAKHGKRT